MAAITLLALWLGSTFGTSFLPPFNEDCYTVFVSTVPGTSWMKRSASPER